MGELVLRTCASDMTSHEGGFTWPTAGEVSAPDWSPRATCGHGLHGLLRGEGDHGCLDWDADAKWLVVEVVAESMVDLGGKVKFPRGVVLYAGDQATAVAMIVERHSNAGTVIAGTATAGARGTATAGYAGTATAGEDGTATAGGRGTATAGYAGTATAGARGEIRIRWWDGASERYRTAVGYVGEGGIEANQRYRLDDERQFQAAPEVET